MVTITTVAVLQDRDTAVILQNEINDLGTFAMLFCMLSFVAHVDIKFRIQLKFFKASPFKAGLIWQWQLAKVSREYM